MFNTTTSCFSSIPTPPSPAMSISPESSSSTRNNEANKIKGRGGRDRAEDDRYHGSIWNSLEEIESKSGAPARSIEGWIIVVTGIHEESHEEDLHDVFREFGDIKNLHLNLDRRTGFVKGYAYIEYEKFSQAKEAIQKMDGETFLDQEIRVDWGFVQK